ncbi:transketolase C-terminal domain-containing protein [Thermoproteus tenax]|uniref:2-oxoacid oxidoreductase (ferredoxin) n=2 Tax=Thermoproteus tenax TaxID=2271 RepID=G4RMU4_THETK|nr:transketolase C-terminal domain-containing protein [Thermoproteus tenax]CAF18520.1 2-oxoglutarate synthase, 2-oxoacid-ferredoxin oxidoreductase A subunit [Thermoproteus tenax]CCC80888.1 2-oxoacid ferredoxin oxidoreductase, alpha subunit [Thermoproteus tenax Kra 1]
MTAVAQLEAARVKQRRIALTGNHAVALAAKMAKVEVIAAYPITPQTPAVERLAEFVNNGELDAEYIPVEGEHSALSAVLGASAAGARVFTATSSQGLGFMYEILPIAVGLRLPIVMGIATRAYSAPINVWGDYSDVMSMRELGWIIYMVSNVQEAFDTTIQAYRVGEDSSVHLPVVVAYDGFWISHVLQPLDVPEDEEAVIKYAPITRTWKKLDVDNPASLGAVGTPEWYFEIRYAAYKALEESIKVVEQADIEYGKMFGRSYGFGSTYRLEDADVAIVTYGSIYGLAKMAADALRQQGIRAGAMKLRLLRPWPTDFIKRSLEGVEKVFVVDRAFNHGGLVGPVATEVAATLARPVYNAYATIGMRATDSRAIAAAAERVAKGEVQPMRPFNIGLRGP